LQQVIKKPWAFWMIFPWVHHKFKMRQIKIVQSSFIHRFIHFTHEYHVLKHIQHTNQCVYEWNTNLWMNECHMNFTSSCEFVYQVCLQCTILICKMYELWINKICTISISKSWDVKFVMWGCILTDI
jgi:hypothetical protein